MNKEIKIFSLAQLNQSLEGFIQKNFALKSFWVIAEITKAQEKNGHHYLELADSKDGKRIAEMSANMWFSTFNRVNTKLNGELNRIFKSGNKVLINVRIEFHTIYGLKLNILDVDPTITYGEIEKKKKETIVRLKKEGLFDLQKNLYLPPIIKKIALIGSPNTSGYRDFLNELKENSIYTNFKLIEFAASVQGNYAKKEIINGLLNAQQYNVDVIIIVRGGGSKMDLIVFNEYEIAKTIAETKIPVLVGIGHETDEVVVDLVANKSEITPTAVAKFIYLRAGIFSSEMRTAFDEIIKYSLGIIARYKDEFSHTSKYLVYFTQDILKENSNTIKDSIHHLHLNVSELIDNQKHQLQLLLNKTENNAQNAIDLKRSTELISQLEKVVLLSENEMDIARLEIRNLNDLLTLLNPEELLKKGYTVTTIEDVDIINYKGDLKGLMIKTLSDKNIITSKVIEVKTTS